MADATKSILTAIATTGSKLSDLTIKNGQLIFVQDSHKIALDFNDKRVFYNRIIELDSEAERSILSDAIEGMFYFVISSCCLWRYADEQWIQLTSPPEEIVQIGAENPQLGSEEKLYVNTTDKNISVWNENDSNYIVVADVTNSISTEEIDALFE